MKQKGISAEEHIQDTLIPEFEHGLKRLFDISTGLDGIEPFTLRGLEADDAKGFGKGRIKVQRQVSIASTMESIIQTSMAPLSNVVATLVGETCLAGSKEASMVSPT